MNTSSVFIWFIEFYQRHLSPYKGFHCAYAHLHHAPSCSHAISAIVKEQGVWHGRQRIKQQFTACRDAYATLQSQRPIKHYQQDDGRNSNKRVCVNKIRDTCGDCVGDAACDMGGRMCGKLGHDLPCHLDCGGCF